MSRVLSTAEAKQAVTRMQSIINNGLVDQINQLDTQGKVLSDPNIWDGSLAQGFRGDWPATSQALQKTQQDLETLRTRVQTINANIMSAGGNAG